MFFLAPQFLSWMGLPVDLMEYGLQFTLIVGGFSFIQAIIMTIWAIIRSHGFTRDAMYVTVGMNILNVIGNYLLLFGPFGLPVMGVTGVAISTTFARFVGLIVLFVLLKKRVNGWLPFRRLFSNT